MATKRPRTARAVVDREVCGLIAQFAQTLDTHVRRVAEALGITATQVVALRELSGPMTGRELAGRMCCEPSNATYIIDRLEQQGLITRQAHPTDRRAKLIVLTRAGHCSRDTVLTHLRQKSPLAPLSGAEQEALRDLLRRLTSAEG